MLEVKNTITNTMLFSEDGKHRYLMTRIWDESKPIPLFVSKCAGEADGIFLELTSMLITNNLYKMGYGGYYAVNLCSGIYNRSEELSDEETDKIIAEYAKKASEIILSWGTITKNSLKEREKAVLKILKASKKKVTAVSDKNGKTNIHILTPSVRNDFFLTEVNIKELLANLTAEKTVKTEKIQSTEKS